MNKFDNKDGKRVKGSDRKNNKKLGKRNQREGWKKYILFIIETIM